MEKIILVYVQVKDKIVEEVSYELIGKAYELARESGHQIYLVCAGSSYESIVAEQLLRYPIQKIYLYEGDMRYNVNVYAEIVTSLAREIKPDIVLIGATMEGRSMAPLVAAGLSTGLTADCTDLQMTSDGKLLQIRPAFGETILAHIITRTVPQMATVRPGIFARAVQHDAMQPHICKRKWDERQTKVQVLSVKPIQTSSKVCIRNEKVLVILGAGVKTLEQVEVFRCWARQLGGELACTRKLVERGWFQADRQVGLSGNAVRTELMIAIGVSGSVQFQAGIRQVKKIIAVNTDPEAPIFQVADMLVLLDLENIAGQLKEIVC